MTTPQQRQPNPMASVPRNNEPSTSQQRHDKTGYDFPEGFRFAPTDAELIKFYLKRRIRNEPIKVKEMKDVNLYDHRPETLAAEYPNIGKNEWYFFTPRDRKYKNGKRPKRSADTGYWKATGADRDIRDEDGEGCTKGQVIGFRKALVFYEGNPPKGDKTNWIMHEYRVNQPAREKENEDDMRLDDWVLCRIYKKVPKPKKNERNNVVANVEHPNSDDPEENTLVDDNNDNHEGLMNGNANVEHPDELINNISSVPLQMVGIPPVPLQMVDMEHSSLANYNFHSNDLQAGMDYRSMHNPFDNDSEYDLHDQWNYQDQILSMLIDDPHLGPSNSSLDDPFMKLEDIPYDDIAAAPNNLNDKKRRLM